MPMSSADLKALLQAEKNDAMGADAAKLAEERGKAMDYYLGDVSTDMPTNDGQSSAISSDVSDTIEGILPPLMEIFTAGEEVVRFEPVGPEDVQAAKQETDYVNHVFMQKNKGFLALYSFIKDALLSKTGIVKVAWEEEERQERETYIDQPEDVFLALISNPEMEVIEHSETGDEQYGKLHSVTLLKKRTYKCAKVHPVPPEEFGISKWARCIADATYCYHEPAGKTEAGLIAQGYDPEQIKKLPSMYDRKGTEQLARETVEEETANADSINKSMRPIKVTEHYIRMDYEEDDKPQLYRVTTGGDELEVLMRDGKDDVEPVDVMPFAAMTPVIMTHRFFGRSIADLVMDIMRIKTALVRQLLNNLYLLNNQRIEVPESHAHERTIDDLLVNRPGGIVRTKAPGGLTPIANQPLGNVIFPALEYFDATREWRTGVTRQGQGIDANALQNQSATAVNQAFTAAQARIKLIARIFAETGIRDLFTLLHGVIRKNEKQATVVRLRNKWVSVDPRNWKTRDDMTISVGLGTGTKAQQIQELMMLLGLQKEAMANGLTIVTPKNIYNTAAKLIEKMDLRTPEPYLTDPDNIPPEAQQEKPDPKMVEVEGKLALQGQKIQGDQALKAQQLQTETSLEIREQDLEAGLAREEMAIAARNQMQRNVIDSQVKREGNALRGVRMGGKVG